MESETSFLQAPAPFCYFEATLFSFAWRLLAELRLAFVWGQFSLSCFGGSSVQWALPFAFPEFGIFTFV